MGNRRNVRALIAMLCLLVAFGIKMPAQAQEDDPVGNVHGLVVSGRESHKNSADKIYDALCGNKLPLYKTVAGNIERYSYDCTKGDSTSEEFLGKMDAAFQNSEENDLNIFFYTGHAGGYFFAVTGKYELPSLELMAEELVTFEEVLQRLSGYQGRFVVITNACGDAGIIEQAQNVLSEEDQQRFSFITACTSSKESSIGTLFPDIVLKKIGYESGFSDMEADGDQDGVVTTAELKDITVSFFNEELEVAGNWLLKGNLPLFQFAYTKQEESSVTMEKGEEHRLKADLLCTGDRAREVKWKSSDPTVAYVHPATGKVTAMDGGTATITSYLEDSAGNLFQGSESECVVTVEKPSIKLDKAKAAIYVGGALSLKATVKGKDKTVSWKSSNPKAATVKNGKVTGKSAGNATITAEANGVEASCSVTVKKPSITLSPKSATLYVGKAKQVKATKKGIQGKLSWSSSNKSVASVSSKGKIKAKKPGKATITAKSGKYSAKCKVTVKEDGNYKAMYTHTSWEEKERKVGNTVFSYSAYYIRGQGTKGYLYATENGKKTLVASGMGLSSNILTNGTTVYCSVTDSSCTTATAYCISEIGGKAKKLFSTKIISAGIDYQGYYGGKVYYVKGLDTTASFCSYDTKTKKNKKIENYIQNAEQAKQYFYLTLYRGDYSPSKLWVYDAKSGKKKVVSTQNLNHYVVSNYLYYVECKASKWLNEKQYYDVAVKRCKLNGGGKKTLVKSLRIKGCQAVTKNAITYYGVDGKLHKKKF